MARSRSNDPPHALLNKQRSSLRLVATTAPAPVNESAPPTGPPIRGQQLYSVRECAEAANVSEATVWRMIGGCTLASVQIGRSRRVPRSELDRLLAGEVTTPPRSGR